MAKEQEKDWATDYDVLDPEFTKDPYPLWGELREKCPIAHSERWGGSWMATRYEDMFAMAQDFRHFSNQDILMVPRAPVDDPSAAVGAPPITADPPLHTWSRRLLLPYFSVRMVAKWEPITRERCRSLLDGFANKGEADAAANYAQQIPPFVVAAILGVPEDLTDTFTSWARDFFEFGLRDPERANAARQQGLSFLGQIVQERKQKPQDDLITYLLNAEVDGQPVPEPHILGTSLLVVLAGIDTTWNSIGSGLWYLAQHPEDCRRLVAEPELLPTAVEELLRAYAPVTMARVVTEDVEYNGCQMSAGDKVILPFPAANRDPEKFPDPDEVIIDRAENPHVAFGVGIHRCLGSNLARMEMRVALEEWLARIPSFRLKDPDAVTWVGPQIRGPRSVPVVFP